MKEYNNRPRITEEELDRTMDAGGDIFREDEQGGDAVEATEDVNETRMDGGEGRQIIEVRSDCSDILN